LEIYKFISEMWKFNRKSGNRSGEVGLEKFGNLTTSNEGLAEP